MKDAMVKPSWCVPLFAGVSQQSSKYKNLPFEHHEAPRRLEVTAGLEVILTGLHDIPREGRTSHVPVERSWVIVSGHARTVASIHPRRPALICQCRDTLRSARVALACTRTYYEQACPHPISSPLALATASPLPPPPGRFVSCAQIHVLHGDRPSWVLLVDERGRPRTTRALTPRPLRRPLHSRHALANADLSRSTSIVVGMHP